MSHIFENIYNESDNEQSIDVKFKHFSLGKIQALIQKFKQKSYVYVYFKFGDEKIKVPDGLNQDDTYISYDDDIFIDDYDTYIIIKNQNYLRTKINSAIDDMIDENIDDFEEANKIFDEYREISKSFFEYIRSNLD